MKRYIWIVFAVLACLTMLIIKSDQPTKHVPTATRPDSELQIFSLTTSWPLPYRAIPTGAPNRPNLPPAPPVPAALLQGRWPIPAQLQPLLMETLTARANWVLYNHPIIWLRETVTGLIDRGQLKLNYNMVLQKGASFDAKGGPNSGGTAQLSLNAGGLLVAKTDEDFLEIMLSVRHEYVHYWRWKNFTTQDEIIVADPTSHLLEYCQFRWDDERDAEFQTCPTNISWGMVEGLQGVCLYSDNAADFNHAYFMLVLLQRERIGIDAIPGARQCLQRWAVIASHPNPDEFKN